MTAWPMSIPYLAEPLPLCDRHGALIGEGKLAPPLPPTLDWLPDVVQLFRVDQRRMPHRAKPRTQSLERAVDPVGHR